MKLAAYLRVSTQDQAERGLGLDVQEAAIRAWAREHGHRIAGVHVDRGISGSNGLDTRAGLLEALEAVERGDVAGVVVSNLDRLARKFTVQEGILGHVWEAGGRVFTADDGEVLEDDPDDPMRTALRQLRGVLHQLDRAMIAKRLRDGRRAKAERGGYAYGAPPFGFVAIDGALVEHAGEQDTLERMRELRGQGASLRAIADTLEAEGRPSKREGARWHPTSVARALEQA